MTKYSNTTKKPDQYVQGLRDHWKERRALANTKRPLPTRSAACNDCFRPSAEASKADLREFHKEDMALRRAHQLKRVPNAGQKPSRSIATGNRHGGEHQNRREMDRRAKRPA